MAVMIVMFVASSLLMVSLFIKHAAEQILVGSMSVIT